MSARKKILVIDDDRDLQSVFPLILEHRDYKVKGVLDIQDLENTISEYQPDLIVLDIWLGEMDGRVVCNFLKSREQTCNIPIILVSAMEIDIDEVKCKPEAILPKPFDIDELLELVDGFLVEDN